MFGGRFGSLESEGRHFFNESSRVYVELGKINAIRRKHLSLRRGRQYLREISGNGVDFGTPVMVGDQIRSVVAWSRIFVDKEMLCAINTDFDQAREAWVTLDASLHRAGEQLRCIYSTDPAQVGQLTAIESRNGKAVFLTVPAAGFVIYEKAE